MKYKCKKDCFIKKYNQNRTKFDIICKCFTEGHIYESLEDEYILKARVIDVLDDRGKRHYIGSYDKNGNICKDDIKFFNEYFKII